MQVQVSDLRDVLGNPLPEGAVIRVDDSLEALHELTRSVRRRVPERLVAVTGSAGKTTTKEMAAAILACQAKTLKNEGNLNNLIGLPLTLFLLDKEHRRAVLEMGMNQPGEIGNGPDLRRLVDPSVADSVAVHKDTGDPV